MYIRELKNTLFLKTASHHLSLQQVRLVLLVEGVASMPMAADRSGWWLLKAGVALSFLK